MNPEPEIVEFDGISAYSSDGGGAGVVLAHEWWGLVPHIKDVCDRVAALGFTVLAPDLYHGVIASNTDEAETLLAGLDRPRATAEVVATVAELRRRGCTKVATMGFCTGAAVAIAASAACPVDAAVAYYGIWPGSGERTITSPILVHAAELEWEGNWWAQPAQFRRWFEGMDNVELHVYAGAQHAFFNDARPEYDEAAATLSWDRTLAFLRRHLG